MVSFQPDRCRLLCVCIIGSLVIGFGACFEGLLGGWEYFFYSTALPVQSSIHPSINPWPWVLKRPACGTAYARMYTAEEESSSTDRSALALGRSSITLGKATRRAHCRLLVPSPSDRRLQRWLRGSQFIHAAKTQGIECRVRRRALTSWRVLLGALAISSKSRNDTGSSRVACFLEGELCMYP